MSRSGYSDDYDDYDEWGLVACWRGVIASATRGKRGQRFFRELVAALDAMPVKRLIANSLGTETPEGDVCALGALCRAKGATLDEDDTEDYDKLGDTFDIAPQLSQEVMFVNDELGQRNTPEERWTRMRDWAARQIRVTEDELLPDEFGSASAGAGSPSSGGERSGG